MVTSREFLDVCEGRGVRVHYEELREAMTKLGVFFKSRGNRALGVTIVSYLDSVDIQRLVEHFGVDIRRNPRLFKSNSRGQ